MQPRPAGSTPVHEHGWERPEVVPRGLSTRQHQVLELLAEGVQAREIAARLDLAEATVRNHIRLLLRKLGCHSQLEAVAVALRLDLLQRGARGPTGDGTDTSA